MASTVELRAILRDEISAGLKGIQAELAKVGSEGTKAGAGVSSGMSTALPSVRGVTDALGAQTAALRMQRDAMKTEEYKAYAKQQREIRKEIEELEKANAGGGRSFLTMANGVKAFMALEVVGFIKDAGKAVFDAYVQFDGLSRGLTAVMGSSARASKELLALKEVARLPGLGYAEAVKMSISLQSAGFSAKEARNSMMAFGNALATVGKGKADLDGVGLALTQIMSKGKVSAEEINQIAERVPQIRVAMQDAFGTANTELIQKMGLTSREFIAGITTELGKLQSMTGGLGNEAENLSDAWMQFKANIGSIGAPVFSGIIGALNYVLETANEALSTITKVQSPEKRGEEDKENARYERELLMYGKTREKREEIELKHSQNLNRIFGLRSAMTYQQHELARGNTRDQELVGKAERDLEAGMAADRRRAMDAQLKAMGAENSAINKLSDDQVHDQVESQKRTLKELDAVSQKKESARVAELNRNKRFIANNASDDYALEQNRIAHLARMKEIEEAESKKGKKSPKQTEYENEIREAEARGRAAIAYAKKITDAEDARREKSAREYKKEDEQYRDDEAKSIHKQMLKRYHDEADLRKRNLAAERAAKEYEWDLERERELHNAKMIEGAWMSTASQMQSVFSSAFQEIGKKHGDMMQVIADGFTNMLNQMLAELAANAAIFGLLSLFAPTGMAASFAGGAGGLTGAIFGQKPTGMKATGGNVGGGSYLIGERGPELFRPTVPGRVINNSTANTYGGVTVHVHGGGNVDPNAIAQSIIRAQAKQSTRRLGGSF